MRILMRMFSKNARERRLFPLRRGPGDIMRSCSLVRTPLLLVLLAGAIAQRRL